MRTQMNLNTLGKKLLDLAVIEEAEKYVHHIYHMDRASLRNLSQRTEAERLFEALRQAVENRHDGI